MNGMSNALTSFNETLDHHIVSVGFLELCSHDPDLPIGGNVFAGFVEYTASIFIGFQTSQS
jgi:hypothetical protein